MLVNLSVFFKINIIFSVSWNSITSHSFACILVCRWQPILCAHMTSFCVHRKRKKCSLIFLLLKPIVLPDPGPHPMISFNLNYSLRDPVSKHHTLRVSASPREFPEKEMATHSTVLAERILWTEEPSGLPSMGSHRVRHDWSDLAAAACEFQWRHKHSVPEFMSFFM